MLWDLLASDNKAQQHDISELLSKGRIEEAITRLKKEIDENPHNSFLHKNMAMAMILKEKFEDARVFGFFFAFGFKVLSGGGGGGPKFWDFLPEILSYIVVLF